MTSTLQTTPHAPDAAGDDAPLMEDRIECIRTVIIPHLRVKNSSHVARQIIDSDPATSRIRALEEANRALVEAVEGARLMVSANKILYDQNCDLKEDSRNLAKHLQQLVAVVEMWLASARGESDVSDRQLANATNASVEQASDLLAKVQP